MRKSIRKPVGRTEDNEYVLVDSISVHNDEFYRVTGDIEVPVYEEELERRINDIKDYETSELAHIYDEENTSKGWDEWINERELYDWVVEHTRLWKYESIMDMENDEPIMVEHIDGGQIFGNDFSPTFEIVYDEPLLNMVQAIENEEIGEEKVREMIEN